MRRACLGLPLVAALALAACGDSAGDPGPGGVTVGEAEALDQAAEMLDQQRIPAEALEDPEAAAPPGEPPADAPSATP